MTKTKMHIRIKRNLPIAAALIAALTLLFDAGSVYAFNGHGNASSTLFAYNGTSRSGSERPSGQPHQPYRRGEGYRADPGPKNYGSGPNPRPGYHPGDRAPGSDPGNYGSDRGPRFYRSQPFSPYGGPHMGGYGERRAIQSRGDAQRMLNDYYMRRNMRTGPVRDNGFYYEADIMDRNNRFMDRVVIDKRSGRIRSIY